MKRHEKGFTSVELLMAIAITFMTVGFVYGLYYMSQRTLYKWNQKVNLEDAAFICIKQITQDMVHAYRVQMIGSDSLVIVQANDEEILYCRFNNNVYRNGYPMLDQDHRIVDWSFREHSKFSVKENQDDLSMREDIWQSDNQDFLPEIPVFEVELTLDDDTRNMTVRSAVQMRNGFDGVFRRFAFEE